MSWNSFSMDRNCNVRGEYGIVRRRTAPICRRSCSHIVGDYKETFVSLIIALSSLLINCF